MEYRETLVDLEKVILKTGDAKLSYFQHKVVSEVYISDNEQIFVASVRTWCIKTHLFFLIFHFSVGFPTNSQIPVWLD